MTTTSERVTDDELAAAAAITPGEAVFHRVQRCQPHAAMAIEAGAAALLLLPRMARDLIALRANERNTTRIGEVLAEMQGRIMPCGHAVGDLIGGTETAPDGSQRPSITKCGACLAVRQPEIIARREEATALAALLSAAIAKDAAELAALRAEKRAAATAAIEAERRPGDGS